MPEDPSLDHAWSRIRGELREAVSASNWQLWLAELEPRELVGDVLVVEAPENVRAWVADRFGRLLQAHAAAALGPEVRVELVPAGRAPAQQPKARQAGRTDGFNPRFTFDQFVIGDANRLAHAAALSVAEMPGLAYSPLFVCGAPGLGKTHLLHSIANYVRDYGDGLGVRYTTAEGFTNHFLGAVHGGGGWDHLKEGYRGADVLLVDDVQFLQRKARTEEEFFHTFNAVHESGAQLVLTSDRPPQDLEALEDRLRERFAAGLVTEIGPPDYATRLTVLRKRVHQDGLVVEPAALELIAARVDQNIRSLEGALIRVVAYASLTGRDADGDLAREVLSNLYPDARPARRTVAEIQEATAAALGIPVAELRGSSRAARAAWARQVAMYLSRELTDETLPAIGREFGRNHTTVMHACKRTAERIASDAEAFDTVQRLTEALRGSA